MLLRSWSSVWLAILFAVLAVAVRAERATYNFDPGWLLQVGEAPGAEAEGFDDAAWTPVTLPRAWNEDDAFRVPIDQHRTGIAWYRKTFTLPPGAAGKKVFIEFEGVRHAGEFYLNGQHLGRHENGVMAAGFDLTPHVRPAPAVNVLAVRTDNAWDYREKATNQRYQWADKNFNANYGGIPKHVRLHVTDPVYQTLPLFSNLGTTGVYIAARDFDLAGGAATIHAESEVRNDSAAARTIGYDVTVAERDGRVLATFRGGEPLTLEPGATGTVRATGRVGGLQWWSWGHGYLYDVTTRLWIDGAPVDAVRTRTGFRQTKFGRGMVELNGRALHLKGYAQRTSNEWPALGLSVPAWLSDFSNGLMVESGANLVRWMHVTPWRQDVESCDRVGLLQAMPAGDSERDVSDRRWGQRVELMRDAIIYYRNHPSIVFYEGGNENIAEERMAELIALRDRYDPHGGRAAGSREMLDSRVAEWGGEMLYINKSARLPLWATEYSRDEGLRKYWDEFSPPYHKNGDGPPHRGQPAPSYNHNQDSHALENVRRWYDYWRERPGTGTRVNAGGVNIIFSDSNTHYRGAENYRRSGEVDAMRLPKDGFFAHQVMWDGWVDVERPRAHLLGHWNYAAGVVKPVHVVSSATSVELQLNGRSLGRRATPEEGFRFTFADVAWQAGVIEAIGYDAAGREVCRARHETTGAPAALRLTARTAPDGLGFKADGADVALVEVEVIDAAGRRVPTALDLIDFTLDGPAEWRGGIGHGRDDNFILARQLPVECGVNRVLVRSTREPGRVTLRATAAGLRPAELALTSVPVAAEIARGVAPRLAGEGLAPSFARGPTPAGPAFRASRVAVPIASARAGSNGEPAVVARAWDDIETTQWANANEPGTAWIEFTLARPSRLTEFTAKFAGWRSRTYPLRVSVDGREVWRGETPRSLGYVTLPLAPVEGRVVRVQLAGEGAAGDAFGGITEVENAANAADRSAAVGRGTLAIVEIEFYEPAPAVP